MDEDLKDLAGIKTKSAAALQRKALQEALGAALNQSSSLSEQARAMLEVVMHADAKSAEVRANVQNQLDKALDLLAGDKDTTNFDPDQGFVPVDGSARPMNQTLDVFDKRSKDAKAVAELMHKAMTELMQSVREMEAIEKKLQTK